MNEIHPTAIIGQNVKFGSGNIIGPGVVISGNVEIGDSNWIGPNAVIGTPPEIYGLPLGPFLDERVLTEVMIGVKIGSRNVIREFVTIHAGEKRATTIASNVLLQRGAHIGHDAQVGPFSIISCNALIGGHVIIYPYTNVGMGSLIHQKLTIGTGAMIGMGSSVRHNVENFRKVLGNPSVVAGINAHLLRSLELSKAEQVSYVEDFPNYIEDEMSKSHQQWEKDLLNLEGSDYQHKGFSGITSSNGGDSGRPPIVGTTKPGR